MTVDTVTDGAATCPEKRNGDSFPLPPGPLHPPAFAPVHLHVLVFRARIQLSAAQALPHSGANAAFNSVIESK